MRSEIGTVLTSRRSSFHFLPPQREQRSGFGSLTLPVHIVDVRGDQLKLEALDLRMLHAHLRGQRRRGAGIRRRLTNGDELSET